MKVKIIKCSGRLYWYRNLIEHQFIFMCFHESGDISVGEERIFKYKGKLINHIATGYLVKPDDCEFVI